MATSYPRESLREGYDARSLRIGSTGGGGGGIRGGLIR